MKAARLYGRKDLRVEDVPTPTPGPDDVLLRNAFAGICGSDLHVYFNPEAAGFGIAPHPLTGSMPPQILGHEFAGTVLAVGDRVTGLKPGDRAAIYPTYSCGVCPACRRGHVNACRIVGFHGLTSDGGGMAEYTTVAATRLHLLPDEVDLRMGALVEPMAVAWHAVDKSEVRPRDVVLVAGAGPIGVGVWFALRARGVERVLLSEPAAARRSIAERLGATVVDPQTAHDAVAELTDGTGVDVAFEAAGSAGAFAAAAGALVPGGRCVVVAIHEAGFEFNPTSLVMREIEVVGSLAYLPGDFDAVIAAMAAGHYDATGWVEQVPVDDVISALTRLREGSAMKILVEVS